MRQTTTAFPRRGEYGFDGNMTGVAGVVAFLAASLAATAAAAAAGLGTVAAITTLVAALLLTTLGFPNVRGRRPGWRFCASSARPLRPAAAIDGIDRQAPRDLLRREIAARTTAAAPALHRIVGRAPGHCDGDHIAR